jgi:arylsulfatase A-like enzyme
LDGSIETTLLDRLSDRGYRTYGISANGFASQRTGFHEGFDKYYYTGGRELYPEGLDVSGFAQRRVGKDETVGADVLAATLKEIVQHDRPLKSLANLFSVGLGEVADSYELFQRIPHPIVSPDSGYCYSPDHNTNRFRSVLENHDDSPFFVFMNYMDTHRPYKPRPELQEKHLGRTLSFSELRRLSEHVAYPWEFAEDVQNGTVDEDDVEAVRGLYAGEVETADEHLARLRQHLSDTGEVENTLIVVTSDHGENLGEVDERGKRRMGHEASVSDPVLRAPLLLAHPELKDRTITEPVSLKDLFELFVDGTSELVATGGEEIPGLLPFESITASQYPATGGEKFFARHPEVDDTTIEHRVAEHSAVTYNETWKVIAESTGDYWVGTEDGERDIEQAPDLLLDIAEKYLERLEEEAIEGKLSDDEVSQLEALGYL